MVTARKAGCGPPDPMAAAGRSRRGEGGRMHIVELNRMVRPARRNAERVIGPERAALRGCRTFRTVLSGCGR